MFNFKLKKSFKLLCTLLTFALFAQSCPKAKSEGCTSYREVSGSKNGDSKDQAWSESVTPSGMIKYSGLLRGNCVEILVDRKSNVIVSSLNSSIIDMFNKLIKYMLNHIGASPTAIMDAYGMTISEKIYITKNLSRVLGITK